MQPQSNSGTVPMSQWGGISAGSVWQLPVLSCSSCCFSCLHCITKNLTNQGNFLWREKAGPPRCFRSSQIIAGNAAMCWLSIQWSFLAATQMLIILRKALTFLHMAWLHAYAGGPLNGVLAVMDLPCCQNKRFWCGAYMQQSPPLLSQVLYLSCENNKWLNTSPTWIFLWIIKLMPLANFTCQTFLLQVTKTKGLFTSQCIKICQLQTVFSKSLVFTRGKMPT